MDRKEIIMMKKIFAGAMAAGILWCSCTASVSALPQKQSSMRDITTAQLVKDMRPHVLPRWTDENDLYDRIWE